MDTLTIIAYAVILYGVFTLYIAWAKPKAIWNIGKAASIQLAGMGAHVVMMCHIGNAANRHCRMSLAATGMHPTRPSKPIRIPTIGKLNNDYGIVQSSLLPSKERKSQ